MADLRGYIVRPGLGLDRYYRADLMTHIGIDLSEEGSVVGYLFWFYPDGKDKPGNKVKITIWAESGFDFDSYFKYHAERVNKDYSSWVDSSDINFDDFASHAGHWKKGLK